MKNPNKDKFEITELLAAQVNKDIMFYGPIIRSVDSEGNPVVYGRIKVNETIVCAMASDRFELGTKSDEFGWMVYYELI